jgi:hypothetical protein
VSSSENGLYYEFTYDQTLSEIDFSVKGYFDEFIIDFFANEVSNIFMIISEDNYPIIESVVIEFTVSNVFIRIGGQQLENIHDYTLVGMQDTEYYPLNDPEVDPDTEIYTYKYNPIDADTYIMKVYIGENVRLKNFPSPC